MIPFGITGLLGTTGYSSTLSEKDSKSNYNSFEYMHILTLFYFLHSENRVFLAAKEGRDDELIRILNLTKFDINCRHKYGWTLLQVAAANKRTSTVKLLLDLGADPNLGDDFSNALQVAETLKAHSLDGNCINTVYEIAILKCIVFFLI